MAGSYAKKHVPDSFWTDCLVPAIKDNLREFKEHSEHISVESFLDDFTKCLVSFALRGVPSKELLESILEIISMHAEQMSPKSIENLLFYIDRCANPTSEASFTKLQIAIDILFDMIVKKHLVLLPKLTKNQQASILKDHLMLLSLIHKFNMHESMNAIKLMDQVSYLFQQEFLSPASKALNGIPIDQALNVVS